MNWPSKRSLIIAFSSYLSVGLALYVALWLDLQNPWWAMLTVYVTQPPQRLTGAIWSKCIYRIGGTLIGGVVCIALIPAAANSPTLLLAGIGGWMAVCVFCGLLDRTPRSYLFLLGGYTVALVGLPLATNPGLVFDVVVDRMEEIVIGVLAVAIVQSVIFPLSVGGLALGKLDGMMAAMRVWLAQALADPARPPPRRELLLDLGQVNALAADWSFEGTLPSWRRRALWALEERLVMLLPTITAVDEQMAALAETDGASSEAQALASRVAAWAATAGAVERGAHGAGPLDVEAAERRLGPNASWRNLLLASLTRRLGELTAHWEEACVLAGAVKSATPPTDVRVVRMIDAAKPRALHVDPGIAVQSALAAAVTLIALGVFSVMTRWELGFLSIGIAAVCCALFAMVDDPRPLARNFLSGFCAALPIALVFAFAVLPRLDGFPLLMASLFPVLVPVALLYAQPKHAVSGLGVLVGFSVLLAIQPSFAIDLPTLLNGFLAAALGVVAAWAGLSVMRIIPTERAVSRLLKAEWRELASLLRGSTIPGPRVWASRMMDRVGLLIPRLLSLRRDSDAEFGQILREPRLAIAAMELKRLSSRLDAGPRFAIDAAFTALADHFDRLGAGAKSEAPAAVLTRLDAAIAQILAVEDPSARYAAAADALSIRRTLFPTAPAIPLRSSSA